MEKEQDFIFGLEKVQTVEHIEKGNFHFPYSATYFFEAWLSCTQIQANMYNNSKTVDFWIPHAKNIARTNC